MKFVALILPALVLAAPSDLEFRQAPATVVVNSIRAEGDGCPPGTFQGSVTPDGASYFFTGYSVALPTPREKFCDVFLGVTFPLGCTDATFTVTNNGDANIAGGATVTLRREYSFSPGSGTNPTSASTTFTTTSGFNIQDVVRVRENIVAPNQQNVTFRDGSRLLIQAANGGSTGSANVAFGTVTVTSATAC